MVKALLFLGALLLISIATFWKNESKTTGTVENGLNDTALTLPSPETLGVSTNSASDSGVWKTYEDSSLGIRIKYPEGVDIKQISKDTVSLSNDLVSIHINSIELDEKETVNTVAEKDINKKTEKLGEKFNLVDSISPISIGEITSITFTAREEGTEHTFYYVPREKSYLLIDDSTDQTQISISDSIIYSLVLL